MRQVLRAVRHQPAVAAALAVVLVLGLGTLGWALLRADAVPDDPVAFATADPTLTSAAVTPSSSPSLRPSPSATAKPSPTRKPATRRPTPRPTPTVKPPAAERPPAPQPLPTASPDCTPTYAGPKAPLEDVRDALVAAGAREYWQGTEPPAALEGPLPTITVPANLMKAIAWQESGWQSTIIACDGGIGTMQVMPGTATTVNNRFGTSHDINTLAGNTSLGAAYLEWLIMYFGLFYFGDFDLSATADVGTGGATMRLLDVVVAAYNVGPGNVEDLHGTADGSDDTLSIPNPRYVDNVLALMTNCVCLEY
ncbi:MAG TPA: transglycosylase SLT domain-containing protein [Micromonosporaceae bacterium]